MGGGAWPVLVGGLICLVNSVNERDLDVLTSHGNFYDLPDGFLEGLLMFSRWKSEAKSGQ